MPYAAALSANPDASAAAADAADRVADSIGTTPDAAVLFATTPHRDAIAEIATVVRERLAPSTLIGASAVSVVGGGLEIEEGSAVSLWAGSVGAVRPVRMTVVHDGDGRRFEGVDLDRMGDAHSLILLPDPFTFPVNELIDLMADPLPGLVMIGGLASAAHRPGDNRLVLDGDVFDHGAVGLLVAGGTRITTVVSQGCRPIGRPLVVTRSEGNEILELAGRSAYEQLARLIGGLSDRDRDLASSGLHIGRVIDEHKTDFERGDFLIRGVLGADRTTGGLVVGDVIPVGATVQLQVRDAESADEDLRQLMTGQEADGALLFTCNGRGSHLFNTPHHDAGLVSQALDDAPLGGMFCAGEIGPIGGRSFVHGYTASLALFHDD